jgi:hypothetical protein
MAKPFLSGYRGFADFRSRNPVSASII